MSMLRQASDVKTLAWDYAPGFHVPAHTHRRDQLVFASSGVMAVHANGSAFVVPPQRAVWIPARTRHEIDMIGRVSMRTVYLRSGLAGAMPSCCAIVHVSPLT